MRSLKTVVFFSFLLIIWQGLYLAQIWSELILPSPIEVFSYLKSTLSDGTLLNASWITLRRLLIGYSFSIICGIPLGMLCARFTFIELTLGNIALGLQTLPSVCWVPLALLWFGQTEKAVIFVVLMGSLWSLILSTEKGIHQVPTIFVKAARTMGAKGLRLWLTVMLPASLPFLVSGLKQSWAFAWRSLMAAEVYVSIVTGLGLGQLLHYGREMQAMDQVIAIMLVVVGIGLFADRILFLPIESELHKRWGTGKKLISNSTSNKPSF